MSGPEREPGDGGQAFPGLFTFPPTDSRDFCDMKATPGMSLRAWLAGQALAGICASLGAPQGSKIGGAFGEFAVMAADSVLAALRVERPK